METNRIGLNGKKVWHKARFISKMLRKAVDLYFCVICVSFRELPDLTDGENDNEIRAANQRFRAIKQTVTMTLQTTI